MIVKNLKKYKGADAHGECAECGLTSSQGTLYRVTMGSEWTTSFCLCKKHARTLKSKLFYLEGMNEKKSTSTVND